MFTCKKSDLNGSWKAHISVVMFLTLQPDGLLDLDKDLDGTKVLQTYHKRDEVTVNYRLNDQCLLNFPLFEEAVQST